MSVLMVAANGVAEGLARISMGVIVNDGIAEGLVRLSTGVGVFEGLDIEIPGISVKIIGLAC